MSCILVYSEKKKKLNGGTPLNGPLVMDKSEILYSQYFSRLNILEQS